MNVNKMRFAEVVARLPEKSLVKHTSPPFEYWLIPGGFLNSQIPSQAAKTPSGRKMISVNIDEVEDGSVMAYLDEEVEVK